MRPLKTIVVVSLYNRYENLQKWVHAWNLCSHTENVKLFIVNNIDEGTDCSYWEKYCRNYAEDEKYLLNLKKIK